MDPRLFEAARAGDVAMVQRILEDDPTALHRVVISSNGETPLHIAALLGHSEFVRAVLAGNPALAHDCNEQGSSPLHLAAANGHVQVVEELLKVGNDLCLLRDNDGRLPLHVAALKRRADVLAKLITERPDTIRELTDGGDTVLHLSTTRPVLRCPGIDVNATNRRGATALAVLLESPREHGDVQLEQNLFAAGGKLERSPSLPQSHVVQTPTMRSSLRRSSGKDKKQHSKWLKDTRSTLMVVAILIATITFTAAVNPPGGYYSHAADDGPPEGDDGQVIIGNEPLYNVFMVFDVIGLSASLGIILLLLVIPLRWKLLMAILVRVMFVAIIATAMAYFFLTLQIIPWTNCFARRLLLVFFCAWTVIMTIALSCQLVQGVTCLLKKLGLKMKKMCIAKLLIIILLGSLVGFTYLLIKGIGIFALWEPVD